MYVKFIVKILIQKTKNTIIMYIILFQVYNRLDTP